MSDQGRKETLQLRVGEVLAVFSPPGCEGWWIRSYVPPMVTGKGEVFRNGDTAQLADGLFNVNVTLPQSWLDREFASPAEAAAFVNAGVAEMWQRVAVKLATAR
jgi:hypothetical protein